jgi:hypothetical protein
MFSFRRGQTWHGSAKQWQTDAVGNPRYAFNVAFYQPFGSRLSSRHLIEKNVLVSHNSREGLE